MAKEQRRAFLINPRFQIIFMCFMGLIALVSIVVLYGADFYFFWKLRKVGFDLGLNEESAYFQYLNHQHLMMREIAVSTSALLLMIITVAGLLFSHKICGPLHRLRTHMRGISSGKQLRTVHFRTNDFFPEIADSFNSMINRLEKSRDVKKPYPKKAG